uniref:P21-activated protein kinase-interacting protein 1-like n=1 Tax=Timema cristinae TaxID=61476 RepID=A0A7R9D0W5_TIMCR|nr:unnamed protein product [Timema cristinae]
MLLEDIEVIVGTYEEFILGYKLTEEDEKLVFFQSFANHSHRASVRCIATSGRYLASGGVDETIQLYDMVLRKECGILAQHSGTVNCVTFSPTGSHLLSGSEDNSIAVVRTGSWQLEKLWGSAHKGAGVTWLSCHPTGKMALSVGTDAILRTWNLVKGRPAYGKNLGSSRKGLGRSVTCVLWSPDGDTYVIAIGNKADVYNVTTAGIMYTVECNKKISSLCFVKNRALSELCKVDTGCRITCMTIQEPIIVKPKKAKKRKGDEVMVEPKEEKEGDGGVQPTDIFNISTATDTCDEIIENGGNVEHKRRKKGKKEALKEISDKKCLTKNGKIKKKKSKSIVGTGVQTWLVEDI